MRLPLTLVCCFAIGLTIGCYIGCYIDRYIARFMCQPAATVLVPTPAQHAAAVADGWIPGTDGYYRAIYGPDAY